MFERFTDRARRVVVLAQDEARALNHNYIGTEHLLLGLIHEGEGVAAKALESMDVTLDKARAQVVEIIGEGQSAPSGHIPFTPRAKKVLELSLREALQLSHNYIGTEHILLGLLREGEGVAVQALGNLDVDLAALRQAVMQLLSGYDAKETVGSGASGSAGGRGASGGVAGRGGVSAAGRGASGAAAVGRGGVGDRREKKGQVRRRAYDVVRVDALEERGAQMMGGAAGSADQLKPIARDADADW